MIRILGAALLAALLAPVSHAGAAQPATQPEQWKTAPNVFMYSAPSRSYLGVDIRDINKQRMAALKLKEERGVEVTLVDQDAPAGKAGIREGDVILQFNNTPVESGEQLRRLIRETPPGRTVSLGISRNGRPITISVQLAEHSKVVTQVFPRVVTPRLPDLSELPNRMDIPLIALYSTTLGMQTENLTRQLGEYFGVKNGEGLLVRSVERGSAAEKAGIKAGDVIVRLGDEKLADRSDLARILHKHRKGGKLAVGVMRNKKEQTLTLDLPPRGPRDSSWNDVELEKLQSELSRLKTLAPEAAARELANNKALKKQWAESMRQYKNSMSNLGEAMRNYNGQFKGLGDEIRALQEQLEKQQKEFNKNHHNML